MLIDAAIWNKYVIKPNKLLAAIECSSKHYKCSPQNQWEFLVTKCEQCNCEKCAWISTLQCLFELLNMNIIHFWRELSKNSSHIYVEICRANGQITYPYWHVIECARIDTHMLIYVCRYRYTDIEEQQPELSQQCKANMEGPVHVLFAIHTLWHFVYLCYVGSVEFLYLQNT